MNQYEAKTYEIREELYKALPYTKGKGIITEHGDGVHLYVQLPFGHPKNYERVKEMMSFLDSFGFFNDFCACHPCNPGDFGDGFVTYGIDYAKLEQKEEIEVKQC